MRVSRATKARASKIRSKKSSSIRRSSKSRRNRKKTKQSSLRKSRRSFLKKSKSRKIKKIKKTKKKMKGGSMTEVTGGAAGGTGATGGTEATDYLDLMEVVDRDRIGADSESIMGVLKEMGIFSVEDLVENINTTNTKFYENFMEKTNLDIKKEIVKAEFEDGIKTYAAKRKSERGEKLAWLRSHSETEIPSKSLLSRAKQSKVNPGGANTKSLIELILATEGLDKASLIKLDLT
jgi:hypothetical protein